MMKTTAARVLGNRVDALYTSHRVRLSPEALATLGARAREARKHGAAEYLDPAGVTWELRTPRRSDGHRWMLRREGHARILIDERAEGGERPIIVEPRPEDEGERAEVVTIPGWTVALIFDAQYIADAGADADRLLVESAEIAARFGKLLAVKIDRVDLAADVEGFAFTPEDVRNLVHHGRAGVTLYENGEPANDDARADANDADASAYYSGRAFTGARVGSGPFACRIYHKDREMAQDHDRAAREHARWARAGYEGGEVWRVEYQIRGIVLAEFGARSPLVVDVDRTYTTPTGALRTARGTGEVTTFGARLAAIWSACLRSVRLTVPRLARSGAEVERTRRPLDARWRMLEGLTWGGRACEPAAKRVRLRGLASAAQAAGALASFAAMLGRLDGRRFEERPTSYAGDDGPRKLRELLSVLVEHFAEDAARVLLERWPDPAEAASHVAIRLNAARARFAALARTTPRKEGTTWTTETTAA